MLNKYPEPTVGALIFNDKGEIFLIKTHKWSSKYCIPGGHIEKGESFEGALKREMKEETNMEIKDIKFLMLHECIFSKEFYKKKHFIFLNFTCRAKEPYNVKLNDEAQGFTWIKPNDALKLDLEAYTRKTIAEHVRQRNREP